MASREKGDGMPKEPTGIKVGKPKKRKGLGGNWVRITPDMRTFEGWLRNDIPDDDSLVSLRLDKVRQARQRLLDSGIIFSRVPREVGIDLSHVANDSRYSRFDDPEAALVGIRNLE